MNERGFDNLGILYLPAVTPGPESRRYIERGEDGGGRRRGSRERARAREERERERDFQLDRRYDTYEMTVGFEVRKHFMGHLKKEDFSTNTCLLEHKLILEVSYVRR